MGWNDNKRNISYQSRLPGIGLQGSWSRISIIKGENSLVFRKFDEIKILKLGMQWN